MGRESSPIQISSPSKKSKNGALARTSTPSSLAGLGGGAQIASHAKTQKGSRSFRILVR